jgi:hypothetical protein
MYFVRRCSFKAIKCDVRTDGHDAHYECWAHIGSKKARAAREPPPFLLLRPRPAPTTQRHHRRHIAITTNTASSQPFSLPTSCLTPTTHLVSPTLSASLPTATNTSDVPPAAHPSSPFPRSLTSPTSLWSLPDRRPPSQEFVYPPRLRTCFFQLSSLTNTYPPPLNALPPAQLRPFHLRSIVTRHIYTFFPSALHTAPRLTRAPPAPPPPPPPSIRLRSVTRLRFTCNAQRPTHPAIAPVFRVGARVARVVG